MKAKHSVLMASLLVLAGCDRAMPPGPAPVEVVFSILGDGTRATDTAGEAAVDDWTLLLYRDGRLVEAGASDSGAAIKKTLTEGDYLAFAIVNPPASFRAEDYPALRDLEQAESHLRDNEPGRLVMAGSRTVSVPVPDGSTQRIGVDRLVCKAGIQKVSVQFSDPVLASLPFRLKAIYLTNCYGASCYGGDMGVESILSNAAAWYNRMGFQSDSDVDGLLSEPHVDATLTKDKPHTQEHHFYFYPNPIPEALDSRTGTWARRRTRLVLEAQIGERTYYYAVTLPPSQRNKTYLIEEAVIRKPGSQDPEEDVPGVVDVVFRTETDDWSPEYKVNENA